VRGIFGVAALVLVLMMAASNPALQEAAAAAGMFTQAGQVQMPDLDVKTPNLKLKFPEVKKPAQSRGGGQSRSPARPARKVPPGLSFTDGAGCQPAGDWRSSSLDGRIRTMLTRASRRYQIRVSCLRTGHSTYVKGTRRVSNHTVWQGADIDRVNGQPVRSWNQAAKTLAREFGGGQMGAQPSEVGSPWFSDGLYFTDDGHKDHLHIGV
jgi:hypothetical protein